MKKTNFIGFLWFVITAVLASCTNNISSSSDKPYRLKVKIKETDCFRCVQGQIILRELSEVAYVEIVFNGLNDNTINRFLETNALEYVKETEGFKIVSDKEEYDKLNTISSVSEGHLLDIKGNEIMQFQFRLDMPTKTRLDAIKRKGKVLMQRKPVSLKTDFNNNGIDFSVQDSFYVLTNKPMNLSQIFNSHGELIREINGNLVEPSDVFPELRELDSSLLKSLKGYGFYRSSIDGVFIYENEILAGYTISCPTIEDGNVNLYSHYQLLAYPLYDSTQRFSIAFDGRLHKVATLVFDYSYEGDAYAILQQYGEETSCTYIQAKCEMQDGTLVLGDEHPVHYPDVELNELLRYKPILKNGLMNLSFTEYLVNIQSDTVFNLPFRYNTKVVNNEGFNIKATMDAQLEDWAFDGETLGIIYYDIVEGEKAQCHHLLWRHGQKAFAKTNITLPNEEIVSLKLTFPDVAHYLTKDNKIGTICINE